MMQIKETREFDLIVKKIKKVNSNYLVSFINKNSQEIIHEFSEDQMVEFRITVDKTFNKQEVDFILKTSNLSKWYTKALKYIFIKPRTTKEISNYLKRSDLDLASQEQIINKLTRYKYLDDEAYIKQFMAESMDKCLGRNYVIHTLEKLGISKFLINNYIDSYNEKDLVEKLTAKYQKIEYTLISLPIIKQKLILTQKMALKGILTTTIQEVLDNIDFSENIEDTFKKDLNKIKNETNDNNKIIQKLLRLGYTYDYIKRHIDV